ncbi:carboxypeptidase-like regulatory domain-containing protein [Oligoflexus tunisiensis]|uniref:carboxypeptidase-like regulatory domain-containing protein n=1 Tax=Oligoflexus tunisiensis TaxID=708132 RepID=UPI00114D11C5|nr:carboxypeptidase-like regulatory domain-containing protein [Oligoflexus tunisiensis]
MKHYLHRMKQSFGLAAWICASAACSNPGKSGGETPKADPPRQSEDAKPVVGNPTDAAGTRIILSFRNPAGLKNITGYVVGAVDQHGFKAIDAEHFAFFSLKPGRYDFIVEGQRAGDDTSQSNGTNVGIRISGVTVRAGEDTILREPIELQPALAIKGAVRLLDGVTHGAITVQIPGTRIKTQTEADGTFTLSPVPLGSHAIVASNQGYIDAAYESRSWTDQDTLELPAVTLLPQDQALATGIHYKGDGLLPNDENIVTVFLVRPAGMNKFRISETADFAGATWQEYQSSVDLKFPPGGERKVFVQYTKDLQQYSAIFSADIPMTQP